MLIVSVGGRSEAIEKSMSSRLWKLFLTLLSVRLYSLMVCGAVTSGGVRIRTDLSLT